MFEKSIKFTISDVLNLATRAFLIVIDGYSKGFFIYITFLDSPMVLNYLKQDNPGIMI